MTTVTVKKHTDVKGVDQYYLILDNKKEQHYISIGKANYEKVTEMNNEQIPEKKEGRK